MQLDAIDRSVIMRSSSPSPALTKKDPKESTEAEPREGHDDGALRDMIAYDEDLNRLQASLMRSTLSLLTTSYSSTVFHVEFSILFPSLSLLLVLIGRAFPFQLRHIW